jgi:hypothetical protein
MDYRIDCHVDSSDGDCLSRGELQTVCTFCELTLELTTTDGLRVPVGICTMRTLVAEGAADVCKHEHEHESIAGPLGEGYSRGHFRVGQGGC